MTRVQKIADCLLSHFDRKDPVTQSWILEQLEGILLSCVVTIVPIFDGEIYDHSEWTLEGMTLTDDNNFQFSLTQEEIEKLYKTLES